MTTPLEAGITKWSEQIEADKEPLRENDND